MAHECSIAYRLWKNQMTVIHLLPVLRLPALVFGHINVILLENSTLKRVDQKHFPNMTCHALHFRLWKKLDYHDLIFYLFLCFQRWALDTQMQFVYKCSKRKILEFLVSQIMPEQFGPSNKHKASYIYPINKQIESQIFCTSQTSFLINHLVEGN